MSVNSVPEPTRPGRGQHALADRTHDSNSTPLGHPALPKHRFAALDGYRAIAALMVVSTHVAFSSGLVTQGAVGALLSRFDFGVTLFFGISGFLLYRPWVRFGLAASPRPGLRTYSIRRVARVFPAYLLLLVTVAVLLPVARTDIDSMGSAKFWFSHLTLTQIYLPDTYVRGLTQTWSLATEVAFYTILPVIGWWATRRQRGDVAATLQRQYRVLGVLFVIGIAAAILRAVRGPAGPAFVGYWVPAYLDWFVAGMILAVVFEANRLGCASWITRVVNRLASDPIVPIGAAIALLVIAMTPLAGPYTLAPSGVLGMLSRHWLYLAAAFLLLVPGIFGSTRTIWRQGLQSRPMAFLGEISYGIFLWHLLVLELITLALDAWLGTEFVAHPFLLLWPAVIAGSIVLGWLSWIVVERPAISWSHRVTRPARTRSG